MAGAALLEHICPPLLDYSIALVCDAAAEPELDSWETLCGDKRTLGGKETGILECKPPSAGIFGVLLLFIPAQRRCPHLGLSHYTRHWG